MYPANIFGTGKYNCPVPESWTHPPCRTCSVFEQVVAGAAATGAPGTAGAVEQGQIEPAGTIEGGKLDSLAGSAVAVTKTVDVDIDGGGADFRAGSAVTVANTVEVKTVDVVAVVENTVEVNTIEVRIVDSMLVEVTTAGAGSFWPNVVDIVSAVVALVASSVEVVAVGLMIVCKVVPASPWAGGTVSVDVTVTRLVMRLVMVELEASVMVVVRVARVVMVVVSNEVDVGAGMVLFALSPSTVDVTVVFKNGAGVAMPEAVVLFVLSTPPTVDVTVVFDSRVEEGMEEEVVLFALSSPLTIDVTVVFESRVDEEMVDDGAAVVLFDGRSSKALDEVISAEDELELEMIGSFRPEEVVTVEFEADALSSSAEDDAVAVAVVVILGGMLTEENDDDDSGLASAVAEDDDSVADEAMRPEANTVEVATTVELFAATVVEEI